MKYLTFQQEFVQTRMDEDTTEEVVNVTGGRMIHMIQALDIYDELKNETDRKELPKEIERKLTSCFVHPGAAAMQKRSTCPIEEAILKYLVSQPKDFQVEMVTLYQLLRKESREDVAKAIEHLFSINFLCYWEDGTVTFHSNLVDRYARKHYA